MVYVGHSRLGNLAAPNRLGVNIVVSKASFEVHPLRRPPFRPSDRHSGFQLSSFVNSVLGLVVLAFNQWWTLLSTLYSVNIF